MLPSRYQTAGKKPTGGIRAENSTTFRFFSTGDAGEKPGTTARSALASCLDRRATWCSEWSARYPHEGAKAHAHPLTHTRSPSLSLSALLASSGS